MTLLKKYFTRQTTPAEIEEMRRIMEQDHTLKSKFDELCEIHSVLIEMLKSDKKPS